MKKNIVSLLKCKTFNRADGTLQITKPTRYDRAKPRAELTAASTQAGLTLIEAMAALAIFAIGSLGILSIFLSSFAMTNQNQNLTSGYEIAQSAMGVLRANGAQALTLDGATVSANQASNSLLNPVSTVMSAYGMPAQSLVTLGVTSLDNNGLCPCTATVSVSWGGGAQTYTTQSIVGY
ncbi:prepilin-type N-terminal cleavage/methylation domain-containing protein [Acidithiobacillus ferrooxidans]|jgi:type IV pilus assembly protein PilV|uniref:prepilin-type N-terminal cleavage/methylation domain-containing protein n=1 Tax=Acidithiobacillus ferrooxidans TaxID=920 RepID=UPI001C073ADC|nr:prepilin-type N-terminal cleavage/methylation domain-containing protein [Acidithiobacillus ferrooxidans]MBU2860202.1 prepilin-type N-terminal cleavage/methylation domain-containing protein [Acidithiobacillus ferrooxidans]